jgi:threonyl-tRNA synthetase
MFYVGADGQHHTPYMVHRALFGSLERFMALLIEHYKGDFPFWLAPLQLGIVPIQEAHNKYAKQLSRELTAKGFRVKVNSDNDNMRNKIKRFQLEKVPYILVVGDREVANGSFSVRSRIDGDLGTMELPLLLKYLNPQMEQGIPQCIFDEE